MNITEFRQRIARAEQKIGALPVMVVTEFLPTNHKVEQFAERIARAEKKIAALPPLNPPTP